MQKIAWRVCKLKPSEVLKMTIGELDIVIDEGIEEFYEGVRRHADLKAAILNTAAPYMVKPRNGKIHQMNDFLPDSMKVKQKELSEEEQAKRTLEAGRALAAKCEPYIKRRH